MIKIRKKLRAGPLTAQLLASDRDPKMNRQLDRNRANLQLVSVDHIDGVAEQDLDVVLREAVAAAFLFVFFRYVEI